MSADGPLLDGAELALALASADVPEPDADLELPSEEPAPNGFGFPVGDSQVVITARGLYFVDAQGDTFPVRFDAIDTPGAARFIISSVLMAMRGGVGFVRDMSPAELPMRLASMAVTGACHPVVVQNEDELLCYEFEVQVFHLDELSGEGAWVNADEHARRFPAMADAQQVMLAIATLNPDAQLRIQGV